MRSDQHWASLRESGSSWGMKVLLGTYRYGGRWLFRILLFPVICFYLVAQYRSYRASQDYLQRMHQFNSAFPRPRSWHSFKHFWSFAEALLDKMNVWIGEITRSDVVVHNGQIIEDLIAAGQGAVIFVSHLGNFEICRALSGSRAQLRLTVLHHTKNALKFNKVLNEYDQNSAIEMFQVSELNMATAIHLSEKTSNGEFLAIAADRVPIDNSHGSSSHDFLGHPASFPSGPFVLGLALQVPILTLHCIKEAGQYHIHFEYLWQGGSVKRRDKQQKIDELKSIFVKRLEHYCLHAPWQWYNFYLFWDAEANHADVPDRT